LTYQTFTLGNMDSLFDLLAKRKNNEPAEIKIIKDYALEHFKEKVGVLVREKDIVITVRSSSLAGALRMRAYDIGKLLDGPEKRLVFRVGSSVS
jgi:hypothetical protein